jgi:hypothetical protein
LLSQFALQNAAAIPFFSEKPELCSRSLPCKMLPRFRFSAKSRNYLKYRLSRSFWQIDYF